MKSSMLMEGLWALWSLSLLGVGCAGGITEGAGIGGIALVRAFPMAGGEYS